MTVRKGLPAKLALTDADDTRFDFNNLVVCDASGAPRGGITSPIGATIVTGTATMSVSVGVFAAVAVRDGGVVLLANDGVVSVLIGAAPGSNQRTDIIYAKQNDASTTVSAPDANNAPILGVAVGTPGPSGGTPAALPAGAVEIGRIVLSAGNTTTNAGAIAQATGYTASSGAPVPFPTLALLNSWSTAAIGQEAVVFADGANDGCYLRRSTGWGRAFKKIATGTATVLTDGSGQFLIPHTLGSVPSGVVVSAVDTGNAAVTNVFLPKVGALLAGTWQLVSLRTDSNTRLATTSVKVSFIAFE